MIFFEVPVPGEGEPEAEGNCKCSSCHQKQQSEQQQQIQQKQVSHRIEKSTRVVILLDKIHYLEMYGLNKAASEEGSLCVECAVIIVKIGCFLLL